MPFLIGCGMQNDAAPDRIPQVEVASEGRATGEPDDLDNAYAKGVVTRKDGKRVVGQILLQCPGYLTVCFEINSSEPGSSELVPIEDVKCVELEETLDDVDPFWKKLQEELTVVTARSDADASNE